MDPEKFEEVLKKMVTAAQLDFGGSGYAYLTGYFKATCIQMFKDLDEDHQRRWLNEMTAAACEQQSRALDKMQKFVLDRTAAEFAKDSGPLAPGLR